MGLPEEGHRGNRTLLVRCDTMLGVTTEDRKGVEPAREEGEKAGGSLR